MKLKINSTRPSIAFFIFVATLLIIIILAPGFNTLIKIILSFGLIFWFDSSMMELVEVDDKIIFKKGYLIVRKKYISISTINKIEISYINDKGGSGYRIILKTKNSENCFVKVTTFDEIDKDVKAVKLFLEKYQIYSNWSNFPANAGVSPVSTK